MQIILKLAEFTESLTQDVFKLRNEVNDKFFMVTTELEALKSVQKEMLAVQNRNWRIIEEHFEVFQQNIHVLRDCDQLLFSRQQISFNYDTVSSQLALTFANIKSYRGALYTYKINMMNSIQPLLNNYLPMSLVPRQASTSSYLRWCCIGTTAKIGQTLISYTNGWNHCLIRIAIT